MRADYLICVGDIADKCDPRGFDDGIRFLEQIKSKLEAKNMIIINGNHDMNTRSADASSHMKGIKTTAVFNDANYWSNHFEILEYDQIIILSIDTSFHITNRASLEIPPCFDDHFYQALKDALVPFRYDPRIKILLCHHHPIEHSDMGDLYNKHDKIDRGDTLLDLLNENSFDLIIHGHKHFPKIKRYDNIVVFCAGSFSSLENVCEYGLKNTFHILELRKKDHNCHGIMNTWVYTYNAGWDKPDSKTIFPAKTGFGYQGKNVQALGDEIIQKYASWYQSGNYDVLLFSDILKEYPEIEFLDPAQQLKFENYLLERWNVTIHPRLSNGADHLCKMVTKS